MREPLFIGGGISLSLSSEVRLEVIYSFLSLAQKHPSLSPSPIDIFLLRRQYSARAQDGPQEMKRN